MTKVFCEICKKEIKKDELQVWLQTKVEEFGEWNYVEDLKFHNVCWVNKMQSIRKRGQDEALHFVKDMTKTAIQEVQALKQ